MEEGNIVFIHLNKSIAPFDTSNYTYKSLPNYFLNILNYTKNLNYNIHFLGHEEDFDNIPKDIKCFDISKYSDYLKLITDKLLLNFKDQIKDDFWFLTTIRLFLVNKYIKENNLNNTIHLEGDNVIFYDYDNSLFTNLKNGQFSFGKVGPFISGPGIILYKNYKSAENFNNILEQLYSNDASLVRQHTGFYGHISEMSVIDIITRKSKNYIELPTIDSNDNFVFDAASYGQYLFGTNNGHDEGYTDELHFVGQNIKQGNIKAYMENNKPYSVINGVKNKLFNLHLHNKKAAENFK
jgi:hypothetical protein